MHHSRLTFFFFLLLAIPTTCFSWPAKVVSVTDGDTINVLRDGRQVKVRLYGIDTPEKGEDYGQKARELTAALVSGRNVEVEQRDSLRKLIKCAWNPWPKEFGNEESTSYR